MGERREGRGSVRLGWVLCASAALVAGAISGGAQEQATSPDPRVGLRAGFRDAGQAARNMELVASLPKPEGFFDPKAPAGPASPPERDRPNERQDPPEQNEDTPEG
ncbi:MAG TPA: hypothetical protein VLD67_20165, partial [Vicinamibacterales bacterium]|nr:hypothetical protein [Vicinamibacterales bacterium]